MRETVTARRSSNPLYADDFDIEQALEQGIPPTTWHGSPCLW